MSDNQIIAALHSSLKNIYSGVEITNFKRLTGGASLDTFAFDALYGNEQIPLILRRRNAAAARAFETSNPLSLEAAIINNAYENSITVPKIIMVSGDNDPLGEAYIMERIAGETLGKKINHAPEFAAARENLGYQCGVQLAKIHALNTASFRDIPTFSADQIITRFEGIYRKLSHPRPLIEASLRKMRSARKSQTPFGLVHGDYRNGNLIISPEGGLVAILDWELSHIGDCASDIGWLCVNSWRFGVVEKRVSGFATIEEFAQGYEAGGGIMPAPSQINFWQLVGTFKWAVIIMMMGESFHKNPTANLERAVIARRISEAETDIAFMLDGGFDV